MEDRVRVQHDCGVVAGGVPPDGTVRSLGPVRQCPTLGRPEPRDAGGDREAPGIEQPGVVHDDEEPLRHQLAVEPAELRHVGVHRELLTREEEVRVHDRGLDHRPAVHGAGRIDQTLVLTHRPDTLEQQPVAVGVLLAEVARAGGDHLRGVFIRRRVS